MKISSLVILAALLGGSTAFAGTAMQDSSKSYSSPEANATASRFSIPFEFEAQVSYSGDAEIARGFRDIRNFDEVSSNVRLIFTPRTPYGILRLGGAWERIGFGYSGALEVPETLEAVTAVVGFDTQFSDSILFRLEAQPGFYGTERDLFRKGSFNVPFLLGGTYIYSSTIQFVLGVGVDYERKYPVLPGGGIRWKFAPQWTLNAVLPTPRLEYQFNPRITLYGGADLRGGSFRVDDNLGTRSGARRLNHAILTYSELRTGAGIDWKVTDSITLSAEGGYIPYREFDYYRTDVRYHQESGSPYGMLALKAAF